MGHFSVEIYALPGSNLSGNQHLSMLEPWQPAASNYVDALIERTSLAYRTHNRYPTIHSDYRSLIDHPRERSDAYRQAQTKASTLYPLLSIWAASIGNSQGAAYLPKFFAKFMGRCNAQFWIADAETETGFYIGETQHGASLGGLPITEDGAEMMQILTAECAPSKAFLDLSAVRLGHWPILALACRHYRLPLPPDLWIGVIKQMRDTRKLDVVTPAKKPKRTRDPAKGKTKPGRKLK